MARKFKNEVQQRNYDKIAHARRLSASAGRANDNARKTLMTPAYTTKKVHAN